MQKQLLLGVEAIAQGAIDSGISGVYAYPGTPSTEITEYIQNSQQAIQRNIHREWSANEKTAMEAALGMSYAGKRALVCMKHVGMNVAADCFMNAAITGANGGIVITAADDPSMHSSQNEQDSRVYGKFALIPILEPSNQQEAYEMVRYAFALSETVGSPVLLRITTRLAHSRAGVNIHEALAENNLRLPDNKRQFVLLPAIARKQYRLLLNKQADFKEASENSPFNHFSEGPDKSLGIIACGISYNYVMENFEGQCPYPLLKICQYPLPRKLIKQILAECERILVVEEGYPLIEELLKGYPGDKRISGRLDNTLPRDGELNPDLLAKALGLQIKEGAAVPEIVVPRPPALCVGCSHRDVYNALNEVLSTYGEGHVFSDIGCYTLGALPPFQSINSCVDMGASITMAKGASDAGLYPAVAVIGDSTFTHSGMTGLLDAVNEHSPITIIISDNESISMTGGQDSAALGKIESICQGIGVDPQHIRVLNPVPKNHEELCRIIREEIEYQGVSVIIPRRICIQKARREGKKQK
ncbi:indolepyruvate oxidoreductase subunit IorA [Odoribacter laneus]|jgi:indolepyruvate ferredoxin oxidoreductase alpha subunit|uniref:Indolepyruvate oxidoreductase subunit IorA n=2 Tax=Odoribacter laneus TaxID=626933 RepID=H1DJC4_9BACT|nr:thiamine pyrophosphate-dependent enzyme [Odoribacter laneus]EHP46379.1 indolepyruvate ferredoxin oxidoreductase, alpha subunit [Odoribacter laneus YIT 12061]GKI21575.1 indolepyruvate oxidoreductase subunit IorA [Odoribacter laneus]GKI26157.1 indolepyruvate oxidoreductase subunit IorA [Odoribacter laneus]CCZ81124.1 indolepyruvate ferredoxin oxidoreductase alpha subunit [Odoribacter laneus CAG:561]